ncbi:MAG TPA: mannitol dehydrogenase family protein [Microbacteriaceae bacterium]
MIQINEANLASLPAELRAPGYNRANVRTGIVHFGVGGFHRAHQAMFVDRLLRAGADDDWGICGVGVLEADVAMKRVMAAQDCLYTLVLQHPDGRWEPQVIGSLVQYLYAPDDPEAVIEKLADPDTRIVSLTVTEGGYNFDQITGEFDAANAAIQADLQPGVAPRTVFGLIVAGLRVRRERGVPPFTVMSCDNLPGNGTVAHRMFVSFARLLDHDLADWVDREVHFPNSMVDRITPVTTDEDRHELAARFGVEDGWPVVAEPFVQWVLEDDFPLGRPDYQSCGVQMVDDVEPYELMKLRLLNVSHQGLGYSGYLAGYHYVHDAAQNEVFADFLRQYMEREATPTLRPVPGVDLPAYREELIERFSNPYVRDTLARLCAEASDRIPKWLVPVIKQQLGSGGPVGHSAMIVASWARYAEGTDEVGAPIQIVDRLADQVHAAALRFPEDPLSFIRNESLFGDLAERVDFTAPYLAALRSLHSVGALRTLRAIVSDTVDSSVDS